MSKDQQIIPPVAPVDDAEKIKQVELENEKRLQKAEADLAEMELARSKQVLGADLDFDVTKFITDGNIAKKNIKIFDKMYVDIHTLSQAERILADNLVIEKFGAASNNTSYLDSLEPAILAMAITRVNNTAFPTPDPYNRQTEEYKNNMEKKKKLFDTFLESNMNLVTYLSTLYSNLYQIDDLIGEVKKK